MNPRVEVENLDHAFTLFESRTNCEKGLPLHNPNRVYRLDRMRALCRAFDDPQDAGEVIHIAGSKGKGSTAAFIAALVARTGRKVGVYSSPHLVDYRERFKIAGSPFPEQEAHRVARRLWEKLPEVEHSLPGEDGATTFELLTLFGFLLFRELECDVFVLETGLGGRLDATNVVKKPALAVITPIEMEHGEILGPRLVDIAGEKAGIIKSGTPVWSAKQKRAVRQRLRRRAGELGCRFSEMGGHLGSVEPEPSTDLFRWTLRWREGKPEGLTLSMGGRVQAENAALALAAVRSMGGDFAGVDPSNLVDVKLPGRFHFLRRDPLIVIDGAHTVRSVTGLARAFLYCAGKNGGKRPLLVFGCAEDKDHWGMARALCGGRHPYFREVIVTTPGTFKLSNPPKVAESFCRAGATTALIPDTRKAWAAALEKSESGRSILVTGSFFMAGEIAALWPSDS